MLSIPSPRLLHSNPLSRLFKYLIQNPQSCESTSPPYHRTRRLAVPGRCSVVSRWHGISSLQVAGLIARRILCCVKARNVLTRGQRYGFICFGSRVDVYPPLDAGVKVSIGDRVSATMTILAMLPQKG